MNRKKYLLSVPEINLQFTGAEREKRTAMLKEAGADRVFLVIGANALVSGTHEKELRALRENAAFLKAAGFEVGAWLWAFFLSEENPYVKMTGADGRVSTLTVCPTDRAYRAAMGGFLAEIAAAGVDMIMFDDDLRYGFQDMGFGCVCRNHRRMINKALGRTATKAELRQALLSGGANDVRTAFVRANGEALETFCAEMRLWVNKTAPEVRLGFCSCITSWDLDGTSPDRLSRLLAGDTRPFYRLIGAPYWGAMRAWGNRLGDVIELTRAEAARRSDPTTEIFSEGDTFPRPRFATPASFLECYDTALRAAGCTDGILKYMQDYTAAAEYETGYQKAHCADLPLYPKTERLFGGKTCVGVRVYENPTKYETLHIPDRIAGKADAQDCAFNAAARFLTANSIPSVYEGPGVCGIAFGEDARTLPPEAFAKGLMLDAEAALLLSARGVDTGVCSAGETVPADGEYFREEGYTVSHFGGALARRLTLRPGADVLSELKTKDGACLPLSYTYTNAAGQRFMVFAFEALFASQSWMRCYLRQRQIAAFAAEAGDGLPAFCPGHPELYVLAKRSGDRLAVGLWNLFPDAIKAPRVTLCAPAKAAKGLACRAYADGDTVTLSEVPAYGFAFFEAKLSGRWPEKQRAAASRSLHSCNQLDRITAE